MLITQQGRCAGCKDDLRVVGCNVPGTVHVDHSHESGVVRGILCNYCNSALGFLLEDTQRAECLVSYMNSWRSESRLDKLNQIG